MINKKNGEKMRVAVAGTGYVGVGRRILSGNDDAVFSGTGSCERRGLIGTTDIPRQKRRGVVAPSIARNPVSR